VSEMQISCNGLQERAVAIDFDSIRAAIAGHLETIARIAAERTDSQTVEEARATATKLGENRFYLAVLGQFKRGKTTLINSLLGADVSWRRSFRTAKTCCGRLRHRGGTAHK